MKYWEGIIKKGLTYDDAYEYLLKNNIAYITRPQWQGVHFLNKNNEMCILCYDGKVIVNTDNILDKDKNDWICVSINDEALRQIYRFTDIGEIENIIVVNNRQFYLPDKHVIDSILINSINKWINDCCNESNKNEFYVLFDEENEMTIF